jgi:hypothetical protein
MGDSCAQGGKPGIKETGTPEDVPRTAAITHAAGIKKAPADVMGALLRLELHGFPHPVAELAATVGGYRAGLVPATLDTGRNKVRKEISITFSRQCVQACAGT